ncbi:MAG TPA: hypothetical protein VKD24_05790 [Candidatus Angelobacter sp.]|nr:hypothetical protein [Candidatus Angelobacter sp.]
MLILAIFLIAIGILLGRKAAAWLAIIIAVIYGLAHSPVLSAIFLVVVVAVVAFVFSVLVDHYRWLKSSEAYRAAWESAVEDKAKS